MNILEAEFEVGRGENVREEGEVEEESSGLLIEVEEVKRVEKLKVLVKEERRLAVRVLVPVEVVASVGLNEEAKPFL